MDSRSYIKFTGNLTNITGTTGGTYTGPTFTIPIEPSRTCSLKIGPWNMQSLRNVQISVPTTIANNKIRELSASICANGGDIYPLEYPEGSLFGQVGGRLYFRSATRIINVERDDDTFFNQSSFGGYIVNRGWVNITYSNIQPPSGTTGTIANLQATSFTVNNNKVTNDGGSPVCEYGVVWSTNPTPTVLNGTRVFTTGTIGINVPYPQTLSPLPDGATVYFRQYAKNCEETGYGNICSQVMPILPAPTEVYIGLMECYDNTTFQHKDGLITIKNNVGDTIQLGTGQCVDVSLDFHQLAQNSGNVACIQIMKSCNGGPYYYEYIFTPPAQTTYYGEGGIQQGEGNGTGTITLRKGDCVCWIDDISGPDYPNQLRSDFWISNLVGTSVTPYYDGSSIHIELP